MERKGNTLESVRDYYGKILKSRQDLKTETCCTTDSLPPYIGDILKEIHPDVTFKFYGCGSPIPPELTGKSVLDLGSGSGRDSFVLSKLVGPSGRVIGVDMTEEQLGTARSYIDYQTDKFGFQKPNIEFLQGYIEDLAGLGIENDSIDVVVSNCAINLSPNKGRVFSEIFRVLKPGGELFFSDLFADRRIPQQLADDPILVGECLGGALYREDFRRLLTSMGCHDHRVVTSSKIAIANTEIERKVGMINFHSMTVRAFKLDLEDRCEDYGQIAYYKGTLREHPHSFILDDHHVFETSKPMPVCGNTASMLKNTRYAPHFKVVGDMNTHYGLFDCSDKRTSRFLSGLETDGSCC